MSGTMITWILIALTTGKFSEDLRVTSHATKELCVEAGIASKMSDWSCFPVMLPEGQEFTIVSEPPPKPYCYTRGGWFGSELKQVECAEGERGEVQR